MDNLKLVISVAFILSFIQLMGQENSDQPQRVVLGEGGSVYFKEKSDLLDMAHVYKIPSIRGKDLLENPITLTGDCSFYKTDKVNFNWINFQVYKDQIFSIVVFDGKYEYFPPVDLPEIRNFHQYYFECRNYSAGITEFASGYDPYKYFLNLDNYKSIANLRAPYFNYDFIVDEDVYLILIIDSELYFYRMENPDKLPNVKWAVQECIKSPFDQEFFLITKDNDGSFIFHTKTQGQYKLTNFKNNPQIVKINDEPLGDKIFIDDKKSGKVHQLTRKEFKKIKSSTDHTKALEKVLKNK